MKEAPNPLRPVPLEALLAEVMARCSEGIVVLRFRNQLVAPGAPRSSTIHAGKGEIADQLGCCAFLDGVLRAKLVVREVEHAGAAAAPEGEGDAAPGAT